MRSEHHMEQLVGWRKQPRQPNAPVSSLHVALFLCSTCFTLFSINAPYLHTSLLNSRPLILGLTPSGWLHSITLSPTYSSILVHDYHFWFTLFFIYTHHFRYTIGRKTRTLCTTAAAAATTTTTTTTTANTNTNTGNTSVSRFTNTVLRHDSLVAFSDLWARYSSVLSCYVKDWRSAGSRRGGRHRGVGC
jgi:hypothetical protein